MADATDRACCIEATIRYGWFCDILCLQIESIVPERHSKDIGNSCCRGMQQLPCEEPELSFAQLALLLGKSKGAVTRAISKLRESGHLIRVGPDKGGHRKVIE